MTAPPALWRRFRDDERGAGFVAAFIVLFGVLTLAGVGVIVDSARIVSAQRQASSAAYEAARAGANAVQVGTVRDGAASLDPTMARAAALDAASALLDGTDATVQRRRRERRRGRRHRHPAGRAGVPAHLRPHDQRDRTGPDPRRHHRGRPVAMATHSVGPASVAAGSWLRFLAAVVVLLVVAVGIPVGLVVAVPGRSRLVAPTPRHRHLGRDPQLGDHAAVLHRDRPGRAARPDLVVLAAVGRTAAVGAVVRAGLTSRTGPGASAATRDVRRLRRLDRRRVDRAHVTGPERRPRSTNRATDPCGHRSHRPRRPPQPPWLLQRCTASRAGWETVQAAESIEMFAARTARLTGSLARGVGAEPGPHHGRRRHLLAAVEAPRWLAARTARLASCPAAGGGRSSDR